MAEQDEFVSPAALRRQQVDLKEPKKGSPVNAQGGQQPL
jgi:hypothetical protein